jgi:hypothetical protein
MQCFTWLLLFAGAVFVMVSLLRWFEQTADAVERREWDRVALLVAVPFAVWFYPSKVAAGRPTPVPPHEPVKGFGGLPKERPAPTRAAPTAPQPTPPLQGLTDAPPPGTPKEFLGMAVVPPKGSKPARPPVDPEKIAKLKQKMREQGMLKDDDDGNTPGA